MKTNINIEKTIVLIVAVVAVITILMNFGTLKFGSFDLAGQAIRFEPIVIDDYCVDPDIGPNEYYLAMSAVSVIDNEITYLYDYCENDNVLHEAYCNGLNVDYKIYDCSSEGKICENNRCAQPKLPDYVISVSAPSQVNVGEYVPLVVTTTNIGEGHSYLTSWSKVAATIANTDLPGFYINEFIVPPLSPGQSYVKEINDNYILILNCSSSNIYAINSMADSKYNITESNELNNEGEEIFVECVLDSNYCIDPDLGPNQYFENTTVTSEFNGVFSELSDMCVPDNQFGISPYLNEAVCNGFNPEYEFVRCSQQGNLCYEGKCILPENPQDNLCHGNLFEISPFYNYSVPHFMALFCSSNYIASIDETWYCDIGGTYFAGLEAIFKFNNGTVDFNGNSWNEGDMLQFYYLENGIRKTAGFMIFNDELFFGNVLTVGACGSLEDLPKLAAEKGSEIFLAYYRANEGTLYAVEEISISEGNEMPLASSNSFILSNGLLVFNEVIVDTNTILAGGSR